MRRHEKFWPALITPFPANVFPNISAANISNNLEEILLFAFLVHF